MKTWLALVLVAVPVAAQSPDAGSADAIVWSGGVEVGAQLLPQGVATASSNAGGADGYALLRPMFVLETADDFFSLELAPLVRVLVVDAPPLTEPRPVLRTQDWDEASDFGAIVRVLRVGRASDPVQLKAGPVTKYNLGLGHLVFRYSNQDNPDFHPAAASLSAALGPLRADVFASDVLGARFFAGALAWDLGATFSTSRDVAGRYHLAFEAAADVARAGSPLAPPATLLNLDADAMLLRTGAVRLLALGGAGVRVDAVNGYGLLLGVGADVSVANVALTVRGEFRKQAGGFRHGFFGPGYELSRFSGIGFAEVPRAAEVLAANAWSGFGEVRVGVGTALSVDASLEAFSLGRVDVDVMAQTVLLNERVAVQARVTLLGVGLAPRTSATLGAQVRLVPSVYVLASVGTVFFVQPDATLRRGLTGAVGVGFDFATSRRR